MTQAVDFPDWNPPRDRISSRLAAESTGTVAAGDVVELTYPTGTIDNLVIISGLVPAQCAIVMQSVVLDAVDELQRGVVNVAGADQLRAVIPIENLGAGVNAFLFNGSGADWVYDLTATAIAGCPADIAVPAQQTTSLDGIAVPGSGAAAPFVVGQASTYERVSVCTTCDQPYTVSALRSVVFNDVTPNVATYTEVIATAASGGDSFVDVPIGAEGFALVITGTGATPGTASVLARMYRSSGY